MLDKGTLYPCLFIIGAEVLSRGLADLLFQKQILPFFKPSQRPIISHLSFTDNMVIFTNGDKRSLKYLMEFLSLY